MTPEEIKNLIKDYIKENLQIQVIEKQKRL